MRGSPSSKTGVEYAHPLTRSTPRRPPRQSKLAQVGPSQPQVNPEPPQNSSPASPRHHPINTNVKTYERRSGTTPQRGHAGKVAIWIPAARNFSSSLQGNPWYSQKSIKMNANKCTYVCIFIYTYTYVRTYVYIRIYMITITHL